jgi:cytosine/adenosine deaminase-related metal-dependent hydrolase
MNALDQRYFDGMAEEDHTEPPPRPFEAAARGPYALHGCVITPDQRIDDGFVTVVGDRISAVGAAVPHAGVDVIETDGVILPGLIDLHGHPEFNVFAPWEPPRLFANRGIWRSSDEYRKLVRDPWNHLAEKVGGTTLLPLMTRYAEARSLVAGVTAIQGASAKYPDPTESLVRNVDRRLFGAHRARSAIDFGRETPEIRATRVAQIAAGEVTAYYIHMAEGIDDTSRKEFADLVDAHLLTAATVLIHATALQPPHLQQVRDAGGSIVWSPQSNLRLYGRTTLAAAALRLGIPMALGADWLPSGSPSLLAEIKVARRALEDQGLTIEPRDLVRMVTDGAARIAGLEHKIGTLEPTSFADILVLERHHEDPWRNVVEADPTWVRLVTIGGDIAWYDPRLIPEAIVPRDGLETIAAWGRPMLLDTTYSVRAGGSPAPRLADLRAALLGRDIRVGPIFA